MGKAATSENGTPAIQRPASSVRQLKQETVTNGLGLSFVVYQPFDRGAEDPGGPEFTVTSAVVNKQGWDGQSLSRNYRLGDADPGEIVSVMHSLFTSAARCSPRTTVSSRQGLRL